MNNRKKPFDITEWSKKQLELGNDIISRSIIGIACAVMIACVLTLGGVFPPIGSANASEQEATINEPITEAATSPVIIAPQEEKKPIETKNTKTEVSIESSPVVLVGSVQTALTNAVSIGEEILNIQPHDAMESYDTDVFVTYNGGLNIRTLPDTEKGNVVGQYDYGDKVHVVKKGYGWLYTEDGNYIYEESTSTEQPPSLKYLGKFKTTAYCTCAKCCNPKYGGKTAIGTRPVEGRSIAVDPRVIPLHSKVVINGHEYIAEDTGSAVKGNIIDIYIDGHSRARAHGVQYAEVYVYQ